MRLIDADAMVREIWETTVQPEWCKILTETIIRNQPTVDAVPVIRCRECMFNKEGVCNLYVMETHWVSDDDYCSDAERKE